MYLDVVFEEALKKAAGGPGRLNRLVNVVDSLEDGCWLAFLVSGANAPSTILTRLAEIQTALPFVRRVYTASDRAVIRKVASGVAQLLNATYVPRSEPPCYPPPLSFCGFWRTSGSHATIGCPPPWRRWR